MITFYIVSLFVNLYMDVENYHPVNRLCYIYDGGILGRKGFMKRRGFSIAERIEKNIYKRKNFLYLNGYHNLIFRIEIEK